MKSCVKRIVGFTVMILLPIIVFATVFLALCYLVDNSQLRPNFNRIGVYVAISAFVSVLVCMAVTAWAYINIFKPTQMLIEATEQFKNGNMGHMLDYKDRGPVSELSKNIDDMRKRINDDIEEAALTDKESREMISNISHDLKTPITSIKGYVEGLLDNVVEGNPEKREKYLRTIYNKANDMDRLIDELALYSKIGSNKATYNFRNINAKDYFSDCIDELKMELDAKNIAFEMEDELNPDTLIVADPEYLKRVINNIISNSVKNMPSKDGKITFKLAEEAKFIRVDISDNGNGIPAKDLPHIFDRFYRGDTSRNTSQGGSGIGLSIVKKIIEEHGGKIWVSSVVCMGTTMSFILKKPNERNDYNGKEDFNN